ncbi:MAG: hypothetical protein L3K14_03470 [Thermoplasmata archaeon]|nr:hypothetical protein [Thermoplasmata archaeon]
MAIHRTARAFAPAHLTGIFAPSFDARDPRGRGSTGAGLVLQVGVHAVVDWRPAERTSVRLRADVADPLPISREVVRRLAPSRPSALQLTLKHDLPIGQGFGMSAAGALATGLAMASALGLPRQQAIETAHLADLFGGGGLGGVSAILGGGLEVRESPGVPPWGKVRHFPCPGSVFLIVAGSPLPSPRLLRNPQFLRRVQAAADPGMTRLGSRPSLRRFLEEAERFTDALRVGPAEVLRRIRALRSKNVSVAQSMLGRSLFAISRTSQARSELVRRLESTRLSAVEVGISARGAFVPSMAQRF